MKIFIFLKNAVSPTPISAWCCGNLFFAIFAISLILILNQIPFLFFSETQLFQFSPICQPLCAWRPLQAACFIIITTTTIMFIIIRLAPEGPSKLPASSVLLAFSTITCSTMIITQWPLIRSWKIKLSESLKIKYFVAH